MPGDGVYTLRRCLSNAKRILVEGDEGDEGEVAATPSSGPVAAPRQLQSVFDLFGAENVERAAPQNYYMKKRSDGSYEELDDDLRQKVLAMLYKVLDTLDSKTSHLLRLNSIILAVFSILIAVNAQKATILPMIILSVVPLIVAGFAVPVFRVRGNFLGWRPLPQPSTSVKCGIDRELDQLAAVCDQRREFHECVWRGSQYSIVLAGVGLALTFFAYFI